MQWQSRMKRLFPILLCLVPFACLGAPSISYTTYFNNTYTYTNATAGTVTAIKAFQSHQGVLPHAGTVTLDFNAPVTVNSITLTGNLTCAFSNLATNRTYRLKIEQPKATNCTLTLPAGTQGYYTTTFSNGWHMLSAEAWGAAASNVWVSTSSNGTY